jgi:uncharacterized protein YecE (DUF72 family)
MKLKVGCCGFAEAQKKYFEQFPLVEIQQTFYQPPKLETVERWRRNAPEDFVFTLKAWQLITHEPSSPTYRRLSREIPTAERNRYGSFRPTAEVFAAWEATREIAGILRAPVVVFQCPASFAPSPEHIENLRAFFCGVDRQGLKPAWEPRGDWPPETVRELCGELELLHCVDPFKGREVTRVPVYFRLHGISGYRYHYSDDDLRRIYEHCAGRQGFVLFNNVSMLEDAVRFLQLMRETDRDG